MSKEQSAVIKGLAILFMLLYHLGCIEGIQGLNNFWGTTISNASHPVSYFLIVSGYGLYYAYSKGRINLQYLMKRVVRLYLAFWLVLLFFVFGLGSYLYPGKFSMSTTSIILNFLGWRWDYCQFTWFFLPYILMMLSAKFVFRIMDKLGIVVSLICGALIFLAIGSTISRFYDSWLRYHYFVYHIVLWANTIFCLILGSVFAKLSLSGKSLTYGGLMNKNLIVVILLLVSYFVRGQIDSHAMNPFYAVLVIWLILHLNLSGAFKTAFVELGHKSMFMWLAQGFVAVRMFSEYYLMLKWPALIWFIWVIVCYLVALILSSITDKMFEALRLK